MSIANMRMCAIATKTAKIVDAPTGDFPVRLLIYSRFCFILVGVRFFSCFHGTNTWRALTDRWRRMWIRLCIYAGKTMGGYGGIGRRTRFRCRLIDLPKAKPLLLLIFWTLVCCILRVSFFVVWKWIEKVNFSLVELFWGLWVIWRVKKWEEVKTIKKKEKLKISHP